MFKTFNSAKVSPRFGTKYKKRLRRIWPYAVMQSGKNLFLAVLGWSNDCKWTAKTLSPSMD